MCAKQTVIIPKNLIQPGTDAVIEIPGNLSGHTTLVAKLKSPSVRSSGYDAGQSGSSPGTVNSGQRCSPASAQKEVSMVGSASEYIPRGPRQPVAFDRQEYYDFNPDPQKVSTPQGAEGESSMYRDFRPGVVSSFQRPSSPAARYVDKPKPGKPSYKSSPCGSGGSAPMRGGRPRSGGSRGTEKGMTPQEIMESIASIEGTENSMIIQDLSAYQNARRRLIMDTSGLKSAGELSRDYLVSFSRTR